MTDGTRFDICYNRVSENGIKDSPAALSSVRKAFAYQTNDMKHSQTIGL